MKSLNPLYMIGQAIKSMMRNFTLTGASVLILTACLVLTGSFYLLLTTITHNVESLTELNQIIAFVDEDYESDVIRVMVQEMDNVVGVPEIISRDVALEGMEDLLGPHEHIVGNVYRDALIITYYDNERLETLIHNLYSLAGIATIRNDIEVAEMLEGIRAIVSLIFISFMAILFLVTMFIIVTTIRLAVQSRELEITVMRYVGASKAFITVPFILEGTIIGLLAATISFIVQLLLYGVVRNALEGGIINMLDFSAVGEEILMGFVVIGVLTGVIGSCISLFKYMKA
ncbi:MAG: hypothetical protein FWB93_01830 [Oscillospiraceae bacterium]|nr:hypothetical protein [Oscillospiraceae bacterium]